MTRPVTIPLLALVIATAAPALAGSYPVTVGSCEREVTFDAPPTRAVSNDVNLTEMMLALGLADRMAGFTGIAGRDSIAPELRSALERLPQLAERYPTKEVLLGADADFYFAGWNYGLTVGGEMTPEALAPFGIAVYELTESCIHVMARPKVSIEDVYADFRNLGRIFGVEDRAEALIAGYRAELAEITARTAAVAEPVRVFVYDSGEDRPFTAARYAIPTAMIEAAGGRNIADDVESSWTRIGWETVVARDPQIIVIVDYGDVTAEQKRAFLTGNPAFQEIDAVRTGRFVLLQYNEATPGPRNIEAIRTLAATFYPELID